MITHDHTLWRFDAWLKFGPEGVRIREGAITEMGPVGWLMEDGKGTGYGGGSAIMVVCAQKNCS